MSRTLRNGKHGNKTREGIHNNEFWLRHDTPKFRKGENDSFREEEKQHLRKFGEAKYKQKPKSRGSSW